MSIQVIVDTASQFTNESSKKQGIDIIPMPVISVSDGEELFDEDITPERFYENMLEKHVYTTSHASLSSYLQCFEKFYKAKQEAIYFCLSSGLTSSYDTSLMAINQLNEKYQKQYVYSYDSKMASAGIDMIVHNVIIAIKKGLVVQEELRYLAELFT